MWAASRRRGGATANSCAARFQRRRGRGPERPSPLPPSPQRERRGLRRGIEALAQCEERVSFDCASALLREVESGRHVGDLLGSAAKPEMASQDVTLPLWERRDRRIDELCLLLF